MPTRQKTEIYRWAKLASARLCRKSGQTLDWKRNQRNKNPKAASRIAGLENGLDCAASATKTCSSFVSWDFKEGFALLVPCKNLILPFQDTVILLQEWTTTNGGKVKAICLLTNFTATLNCMSVTTSRQTTGHQLLVYTAHQVLVPNTVYVVETGAGKKQGKHVGGKWGDIQLYGHRFTSLLHPEKVLLSSPAYLSNSAPDGRFILHSFHFLLLFQLPSLLQAHMSGTGQRTA